MPDQAPVVTAPDIYHPLHNQWQLYSGKLRELQSLLDEQASPVSQSAVRHTSIRTTEDRLAQTQNELQLQAERIQHYEQEVNELQASLEQAKSKLSAEQTQLQSAHERQKEQQKALEELAGLGTREQELEDLLVTKRTEVDQITQELQKHKKPHQYETQDVFDIELSDEDENEWFEAGVYEQEAPDDSDYTDHHKRTSPTKTRSTLQQGKAKRKTRCIRCREHGYECVRRGDSDNRFCMRCVGDNVPCSYRRPSAQRRPGRKRNRSLDERLVKLVDVQGLGITEIQEQGLLGDKTVAALKAMYRRFKLKEEQHALDTGQETV